MSADVVHHRWLRCLPALLLAACVDSTGGQRVAFQAEVLPTAPLTEVDGAPAMVHTYDSGWTVELTEATVHLGPVYLWSDEPQLQTRWWTGWLVPEAHAAADQFEAGYLRGEVTAQAVVDLLTEVPTPLGTGVALAGPSRSGELWLEPVRGGTPTLSLAGTAWRDEASVAFRADITYEPPWLPEEDATNPLLLRRLRGLLWEADLAEGGLLTVEVDARAFFQATPWEAVLPADPEDDQEIVLGPDDEVGRVLSARIRQIGSRGAWTLRWTP